MNDTYLDPEKQYADSLKDIIAGILPPVGWFLAKSKLQDAIKNHEAYDDAMRGIAENLGSLEPSFLDLASSAGTYLYIVVKSFEPPAAGGVVILPDPKEMTFVVEIVGQGFSLEGALVQYISMNDFEGKLETGEISDGDAQFLERVSPVGPKSIELEGVDHTLRSGTYVEVDLISIKNGTPVVSLEPLQSSKEAYVAAIQKSRYRPNLNIQVSPDVSLLESFEAIKNEYLNVRRIVRGIENHEVAASIKRQYAIQVAMWDEVGKLVEAYGAAAEISRRNANLTKFTGLVRLGLMAGEYVYNISQQQLLDDRQQAESRRLNDIAKSFDKRLSDLAQQVSSARGEFQKYQEGEAIFRKDVKDAIDFLSDVAPIFGLSQGFQNKYLETHKEFDRDGQPIGGGILFRFH